LRKKIANKEKPLNFALLFKKRFFEKFGCKTRAFLVYPLLQKLKKFLKKEL
jgi:hypothetical protein